MSTIHISELRNAYEEAIAIATAQPALYGWDSGAFDLELDELLYEMNVNPITLDDLDDLDDLEDLDMSQVENGEWYQLDDVKDHAESAFDNLADDDSRVHYPIYTADIMRIFDQNQAEVEQAFADCVGHVNEMMSISAIIAESVAYTVFDAYRVDMAELSRCFINELDQADTVTV